jgi:sodium/potassium-transporting ATPase subunit alpha
LIVVTDLGFELFMALSYAMDPPETKGLMKLQPRKPVTDQSMQREKEKAKNAGKRLTIAERISKISEPSDGEVLVDGGLLSWAYLEAGSIEAIGCLTCFFFALWYHFGITLFDLKANGAIWATNQGDVLLQNGAVLVLGINLDQRAAGYRSQLRKFSLLPCTCHSTIVQSVCLQSKNGSARW